MSGQTVILDGHSLTIGDVEAVARIGKKATIDPELIRDLYAAAKGRSDSPMDESQEASESPISADMAGMQALPAVSSGMSVGAQPAFTTDQVRAATLVLANHLIAVRGDVRLEVLESLLDLLTRGVTAHIPMFEPCIGSNRPHSLVRVATVLAGSPPAEEVDSGAQAWYEGTLYSGAEAMRRAGLQQRPLTRREVRAFQSEDALPCASLALALVDARRLLDLSCIAGAMSLEALLGTSAAFDERLHEARPHPGQQQIARRLRDLTAGSSLIDSGGYVQDAYSLRCSPQVTGPGLELLHFAIEHLERRLNPPLDEASVFENSLPHGSTYVSAPLALLADGLKCSMTTVGALSERRIFRLISDHTNRGLPAMLVAHPDRIGLESGMMMLQYSAAALVHENQVLAAPDLSGPSASRTEPAHVSAPTVAAIRRLDEILENLRTILAMEMITAAQALDLRLRENSELQPGRGVAKAWQMLREQIPLLTQDRPLSEEIEFLAGLLNSDQFNASVLNV